MKFRVTMFIKDFGPHRVDIDARDVSEAETKISEKYGDRLKSVSIETLESFAERIAALPTHGEVVASYDAE